MMPADRPVVPALLMEPAVQTALFHPGAGYAQMRLGAGSAEIAVEVESNVDVRVRVHHGPADAPWLLLFHGNGEIAADYDELAPPFIEQGVTFAVAEYRGYGGSGGWPTAENVLADARVVLSTVERLAAGRAVLVMGRSLGSAPAIDLAASRSPGVAGLIVESGVADTLGLLRTLGVAEGQEGVSEAAGGFDNATKMARVMCPTLVIHGERDRLIPPADGRRLYEACAAADKRLLLIPHGDHNDLFAWGEEEYLKAVKWLVGEAAL
jgi:alpha-beta hydrolase superfamily lysophospholipase